MSLRWILPLNISRLGARIDHQRIEREHAQYVWQRFETQGIDQCTYDRYFSSSLRRWIPFQKLNLVYEKIQREHNIPLGDFPKLDRMQDILRNMVRSKEICSI